MSRLLADPLGQQSVIIRLLNLLNQETITAEVRLLAETQKAIKVDLDGREAWIPKGWLIRRRDLSGGRLKIKTTAWNWTRKYS